MEKISEREAKKRYKEELDELKEEWIQNYYGGDVLEEIDPIAFNVGFLDFCSNAEENKNFKVED